MDPIVSQFVLGAIVPGAVSTIALGSLWFGTTRRRAGATSVAAAAPVTGATLAHGNPAASFNANATWLRGAAIPLLSALAVAFAQSAALTSGWLFPPVDAYSWLGIFAIIAAAVGCLAALPRSALFAVAIASVGVAAALPVVAVAAKLSLRDSIAMVLAGLVLFVGLQSCLRKPGLGPAIFIWLLLVACSQTLILAFSSLRLGVVVHTLAAVAGGAMVAVLVWPRLRIGTPGAAALAIILSAVFAQGYNLGSDSAPLWVRLGAVTLLVLSPLVFAGASRTLQSRGGVLASPFVAATASLVFAAIPAVAAIAISAWSYLSLADTQ